MRLAEELSAELITISARFSMLTERGNLCREDYDHMRDTLGFVHTEEIKHYKTRLEYMLSQTDVKESHYLSDL